MLTVRLGSILSDPLPDPAAVFIRADRVYTHPNFTVIAGTVPNNDVALLHLNTSLNFTDTIRPICLPSPNEDPSDFQVCVDTGFGRIGGSSKYLDLNKYELIR